MEGQGRLTAEEIRYFTKISKDGGIDCAVSVSGGEKKLRKSKQEIARDKKRVNTFYKDK